MVRPSKPNIPGKISGDKHYAYELNAVDTAIDAVIDDMVSMTDTSSQSVASAVNFASAITIASTLETQGFTVVYKRSDDPNTTGWGEAEKGRMWMNTTEGKYKYWTGSAILAFPVTGGAGAPVDASYVTINAESGLSAEIQHANITDNAQLHYPKSSTDRDLDFAAGKRPKADFVYFNPSSAPADTEGHTYYDSAAHRLKFRTDSTWLTLPGSEAGGAAARGSYDYIIYADGSPVHYHVEDSEGNLIFGGEENQGGVDGEVPADVLQAVLNVSADYVTVYIKPPFIMSSGSASLTHGNISLISDIFPCDTDYGFGVIINDLTVDSTSADMRHIKLQGISFKHLLIKANGHYIRDFESKNCVLHADTGSTSALVFQGDGTGDGWIDSLHFIFPVFITDSESSAPVVTFNNTAYLTEVFFIQPKIEVYASGITVFKTLANAQIDSVFIDNPRFYGNAGTLTVFEFEDPTVEPAGGCFYMTGGRVEHSGTFRLYYNPTNSTSYVAKITILVDGLATESYSSCTIATGAQRSFTTGITQEFIIKNCKFDRSTTSLGTCPQNNYVTTIIKDNVGVNPIGNVSTPFTDYATAAYMQLCAWGTVAAPTADRVYTVQGSDVMLTSTGGTGVSITVKDADANTYISGASTLTRELIPVGYTVTFGSFSVAPTVTAYFT